MFKDELQREGFTSLLKDLPEDAVLVRTANNETITVRDVQGSELGLNFIHDVLRISRYYLKRAANNS